MQLILPPGSGTEKFLGLWLAELPPVVLSGIIAAIVALVVVVITNIWQGRRERERDSAQRDDQRARDRELWAREDRHRFTAYRRDLYADFLTHFEVYYGRVAVYVFEFTRASPDEVGDDPWAWFHAKFDVADSKYLETCFDLKRMQLIAPDRIFSEAARHFDVVHSAHRVCVDGAGPAEANRLLDSVDTMSLIREMRLDLGEVDTESD